MMKKFQQLKKNLEDIQKELDEKLAEKEQLEKEIEDLKNQVEELNRKAPTYPSKEHRGGQKLEQRDAIAKYIRTGQTRDIVGLKTTDSGSGALIPTEVLKPHFLEKHAIHFWILWNVLKLTVDLVNIQLSRKRMV